MRQTVWLLIAGLVPVAGISHADQTCPGHIHETTPISRFSINQDGSVKDTQTGLTWKRCVAGQVYDGSNNSCGGTALSLTWQQALQWSRSVDQGAADSGSDYTNWRLPNIKELRSLVEVSCYNPAFNTSRFPGMPPGSLWSASPVSADTGGAWTLNDADGLIADTPMSAAGLVLLVRDDL